MQKVCDLPLLPQLCAFRYFYYFTRKRYVYIHLGLASNALLVTSLPLQVIFFLGNDITFTFE